MQSTRISTKLTKRAFGGLAVIAVAFLVLVIRIFCLQTVDFDYYRNKVLDQLTTESTILSERGNIYDSNGVLLATNKTAYRVFIAPKTIHDEMKKAKKDGNAERVDLAVKISRGLSELLGIEYDTIYTMTGKTTSLDATVLREASSEQADDVLKLISDLKVSNCIYVEPTNVRYYCYSDLATHVLGFTGRDGDGLYGLEYYYNKQLAGTPGKFITARDAYGNEMPYEYQSYIDAIDGYDLNTTLDIKIQAILEEQLKATYVESGAQAGVAGMVMNVKTGAVYAMGTYPDFDSNDAWTLSAEYAAQLESSGLTAEDEGYSALRSSLLNQMWQNKALTFTYMPGSTFKIITTAMAIETGTDKLIPTCTCRGQLNVYGSIIHCHKKGGHGVLSFAGGLQQSCNPYMMELAEKIGRSTFYNYVKNFGYLEKTGIDLPGEGISSFWDEGAFGPVDLAVASFGQNFKISPIAHISAINAVANGGNLVTPYFVKEITDNEGNVIYSHETEVKRQVISEATAQKVSDILEEGVATDGGSKNAYVAGYRIAAKTGTSEKKDVKDTEYIPYVCSAIAFAPAEAPEISVLFMVDEPTEGVLYASVIAAPYVANLMSEVLPYVGVEAEYTEEELKNKAVITPSLVQLETEDAKKKAVEWFGFDIEVVGDGKYVLAQSPAGGTLVEPGCAKVVIYTTDEALQERRTVKVPNLVGMTAVAANGTLTNLGLNLKISGTTNFASGKGAVVIEQNIAPGETVELGSVIELTFRYLDDSDVTFADTENE